MQFYRHFGALTFALSSAFLNASLTPALSCALTRALNSKCLLNCTPDGLRLRGRHARPAQHVQRGEKVMMCRATVLSLKADIFLLRLGCRVLNEEETDHWLHFGHCVQCGMDGHSTTMYMVTLVVSDLVWVDLVTECSTVCTTVPGLEGIWLKWFCSQAR